MSADRDSFNMSPSDVEKINEYEKISEYSRVLGYSRFVKHFRFLAYSSEMGEVVRPLNKTLVTPMYALTTVYLVGDTYIRCQKAILEGKSPKSTLLQAFYFHSLASLALPTIAVSSTVATSKYVLKEMVRKHVPNMNPHMFFYGPSLFGLLTIPFIIHPIDHAVNIGGRMVFSDNWEDFE